LSRPSSAGRLGSHGLCLAIIDQHRVLHMTAKFRSQFVNSVLAVVIMAFAAPSIGQDSPSELGKRPENYVAFAQSIYWQALTPDEKQTFLFAYISSAYEVRGLATDLIQVEARRAHRFNEKIDWFFEVWQDILEMEDRNDGSIQDFIGWIDLYYQIDFNRTRPFYEALMYAHGKVTSGDREILDIYWGANPDTAGPKTPDEFEQQSIQRRIATSEAHKSIATARELTPLSSRSNQVLTEAEKMLIALAVETECINKNDPDQLDDPNVLEALAIKFGFKSMNDFNTRFGTAQQDPDRWELINKEIIEQSFDRDCM